LVWTDREPLVHVSVWRNVFADDFLPPYEPPERSSGLRVRLRDGLTTAAWLFALFLFAQLSPAASATTPEQIAAKFLETQQQLDAELSQLEAEHARDTVEQWRDALRAWHERNAARLDAQAQRAALLKKVHDDNAPEPAPLPPVPAELPSEVRQLLLESRAADAELRLLSARWKSASAEQRRDAARDWHEQHAAWLAAHHERAESIRQKLGAEVAGQPLLVLIPADASPEMRLMLTLQADLDDELAAVIDAAQSAGPERLRDAARDWHERRRADLDHLDKLRADLREGLDAK